MSCKYLLVGGIEKMIIGVDNKTGPSTVADRGNNTNKWLKLPTNNTRVLKLRVIIVVLARMYFVSLRRLV